MTLISETFVITWKLFFFKSMKLPHYNMKFIQQNINMSSYKVKIRKNEKRSHDSVEIYRVNTTNYNNISFCTTVQVGLWSSYRVFSNGYREEVKLPSSRWPGDVCQPSVLDNQQQQTHSQEGSRPAELREGSNTHFDFWLIMRLSF